MSACPIRATRYDPPRMPPASLYPMVLMLLITGCAGPMGTIHGGPPAAAAVATFDGTYQSTIRVTDSAEAAKENAWCETPGQPIITVASGQFSYTVPHPNVPGDPTPTFLATFAQDGSFAGQIVEGTISGRASGTHMEGSISSTACVYAFAADRI
jgi:hypothetical protein